MRNKLISYYYSLNPNSIFATLIALFLPDAKDKIEKIKDIAEAWQENINQVKCFNGVEMILTIFIFGKKMKLNLFFISLPYMFEFIKSLNGLYDKLDLEYRIYDLTDLKARYIFYMMGADSEGVKLKSDPNNKFSRYIYYTDFDQLPEIYQKSYREHAAESAIEVFVSNKQFQGAFSTAFGKWLFQSNFDQFPEAEFTVQYTNVVNVSEMRTIN